MSRPRRVFAAVAALVAILALAGCPKGGGDTCTVTTNGSPSPCPPDEGGNGGGY